MPRRCIFCGRPGPLSNEHIWTDRINSILGSDPGIYSVRVEGPDAQHRPARWIREVDDQVKRTCRDHCNNGWLRDLEQDAWPTLSALVQGQEYRLTPAHQRSLALWAMRTALLAEFHGMIGRNIPEPRYREFYDSRKPARDVVIWAIHYVGQYALQHHSLHVRIHIGDYLFAESPDGYCSTFVIGELALQVTGFGEGEYVPANALNVPPAIGAEKLWPPTWETILWPPRYVLGDDLSHYVTAGPVLVVQPWD